MIFTQKKRIKGKTAKTYKEWYDETGQYRISWRKEVHGVSVPPGFFACVRCVRSPWDREEYWGFANRRGLYRTLKAAQDACELSLRLWNAFLSIEGRAKVRQVRDLIARSMIGKKESAYSGLSDLPVWICEKATPRLLDILQPRGKIVEEEECESQDAPTRIWRNSDATGSILGGKQSSASQSQDGPACDVVETEPSLAPNDSKTPAPPVKAPVKAPVKERRKRSSKRTTKKSKRGKKKSPSGRKKKRSSKKRSAS